MTILGLLQRALYLAEVVQVFNELFCLSVMGASSSLHLLIVHVLVLSIDQIQLLHFRLELSLDLFQVFEVALEISKCPELA